MERLLVTGASGFLGSRIVDYYSEKFEVYAPRHEEMDITDRENVYAVFQKVRPYAVIHSAAVSDVGMCEKEPEKSWKINVDGSRNIAMAAEEFRSKYLFCSSDQVYIGSNVIGLHKDSEELMPQNVYAKEKRKAEEECLAQNPGCVILRLSWMYDIMARNELEHGDFFRTLTAKLQTDQEISYPIYDVRGITDVNEVIRNLEKAMELPGGIYNFGSPNDRNTYETVEAMFHILQWDAGRLKKNETAFAPNPRNISMSQEKLKEYGIVFPSTLESLVGNGKKYENMVNYPKA